VAGQQFEQQIINNFDNNYEIFSIKYNCPNKCLYGPKFIPTDWLDTKLIERFVHSKPSNCKGRMGVMWKSPDPRPLTPTNQNTCPNENKAKVDKAKA
jgi:hypothetical protein